MLIEYDFFTSFCVEISHNQNIVFVYVLIWMNGPVVERQLFFHHDLIDVESCSFGVFHQRFCELCDFSHHDLSVPDDEHFLCFFGPIRDNLSGVELSEGEADHEVVYESLLTP